MAHDTPVPQSKPCLWAFDTIRPLLLRAGELTPVEKAERRVLILSDPGRGPGAMRVAGPIFCGRERAPLRDARAEQTKKMPAHTADGNRLRVVRVREVHAPPECRGRDVADSARRLLPDSEFRG